MAAPSDGLIHDLLTITAILIALATFLTTRQSQKRKEIRDDAHDLEERLRHCEQQREAISHRLAEVREELEEMRVRYIAEVSNRPRTGGEE